MLSWLVINLLHLVDFSGAVRALGRVVAVGAIIGPTIHPERAPSTALWRLKWMLIGVIWQLVQDVGLRACLLFNHEWQRSTLEVDFGLQDNLFGLHVAGVKDFV